MHASLATPNPGAFDPCDDVAAGSDTCDAIAANPAPRAAMAMSDRADELPVTEELLHRLRESGGL